MTIVIAESSGAGEIISEAARIIDFTGRVEVGAAARDGWIPARPGHVLVAGDQVRTGPFGRASLLMADETLMQLGQDSEFELQEVPPKAGWQKRLDRAAYVTTRSLSRLKRGNAWFLNKDPKAILKVRIPTAMVGVRGTELVIRVGTDSIDRVGVLEGMVEVVNEQGGVMVAAGEEAHVSPNTAPVKQILLHPEDAVQWTISVPSLFGPGDFPLTSGDREHLRQEKERLSSLVGEKAASEEQLTRLFFTMRDLGLRDESSGLLVYFAPGGSGLATCRGWLLLDQGKYEDGLNTLRLAPSPSHENLLGQAIAFLALRRFNDADQLLRKIHSTFPDSMRFQLISAWTSLQTGAISEALAQAGKIVENHSETVFAWEIMALAGLTVNLKAEGLRAAEQAVQLAPWSATPWIIMSYVRQARFEIDLATAAAEKALEIEPDNVTALLSLSRLQFGQGFTGKALQTVERAVSLAPASAEVNSLRGFVLLGLHREDAAAVSFERAVAAESPPAEAYLGRGLVLMRQGEAGPALEAVSSAVLLEPRRAIFRSYWAKMLYQLKRYQKALDVLNIARNIDPHDPTPELYRALILRDMNRPTEAVQAIGRAISLNDNRAVYRSRFLLDRDLAVKNVNLALLYEQLGVSAWARNKAAASIRDDYANGSAHLFYGGSLAGEVDRSWARNTENLLARLLQPANVNTFNTFNDYTSFVEKPSLDGDLLLGAGNHHSSRGELQLSGSLPKQNLAFQLGYFGSRTDGWRASNFEDAASLIGYLKWDLSLSGSLTLVGGWTDYGQGDRFVPRFEYDAPAEPRDRFDSEISRVEVGYHHNWGPGADLLLHYANIKNDSVMRINVDSASATPLFGGLFLQTTDEYIVTENRVTNDFQQFQGEFVRGISDHQLILGGVHYWGDEKLDGLEEAERLLQLFDGAGTLVNASLFTGSDVAKTKQPRRSSTYYLHDIWQVGPVLTMEGGLYYERMETGNSYNPTRWVVDKINPRLGLVINPFRQHTVRLAAFRYLQPFASDRLDPADIAGVPVFRNGNPGSVTTEADLAYEYEWGKGFCSAGLFYLDRDYPERQSSGLMKIWQQRQAGFTAGLNLIGPDGLGLAAGYRYLNVDGDPATAVGREEHQASASLNFIHADGFSARLAETFRYLNFGTTGEADERIWLTDLTVSYDLPGKRGEIRAEIRNVFDQDFNWLTDEFVFQGRVPAREFVLQLRISI